MSHRVRRRHPTCIRDASVEICVFPGFFERGPNLALDPLAIVERSYLVKLSLQIIFVSNASEKLSSGTEILFYRGRNAARARHVWMVEGTTV